MTPGNMPEVVAPVPKENSGVSAPVENTAPVPQTESQPVSDAKP